MSKKEKLPVGYTEEINIKIIVANRGDIFGIEVMDRDKMRRIMAMDYDEVDYLINTLKEVLLRYLEYKIRRLL